ncbi:MAG: T9SS type A sorting domain-containing protein [bacterium]|nr:T9SS type A sorting domain-containing protein [bacterium]
MRTYRWLALCAMVCAAGTAAADWAAWEIDGNTNDADWPALAVSPGNTAVIAWEEEGVGVWTRTMDAYFGDEIIAYPPTFHGPGHRPVVAWTWRGFLLVWTDGWNLVYRYGDELGWGDPSLTIPAGRDLAEARLDLQGCAEPGWSVGWLACTLPAGAGVDHWSVRFNKGSYDPPELLAAGSAEWGAAQVAQVPHVPQPLPRVYYFPEFTRLGHRDGQADGGWSPPVLLPAESYGAACDARAHADGRQAVLSLGPQPTCPCNTVHYSEQDDAGNWSAPLTLLESHDEYDWPFCPQVAWGDGDEVHAFWVQPTYNAWMEPGRVHLEYRHRTGGVWLDESAALEPYERRSLGLQVALATTARGDPLFAWTRQDTLISGPQPRRVWLARPRAAVAAPAAEGGGMELSAWPNPGRSRLAFAGSAPAGAPATLAVYDLAGRRVAAPALSADGAGRFTAVWDGRDGAGREAPAGVYLLRLDAGGRSVTRRAVLAR